ncbi:ATP-dependent DNA ligase [Streptomyces wedmorensis]
MRPRSADEIPGRGEPPRELRYSLEPDGFRALAFVLDGGRVVLRSRSRRDLAPAFPGIAAVPGERLPAGVVCDGESCAYREGRLGFTDLLRSHADRVRAGVPVSSIAFDLLAVPGRDVRSLPLRDRWELLGAALGDVGPPLRRVPATRDEETARGWFRDPREAGRRGDRRQTAGLAVPGRRHPGLAQGPARRHERRPARGPGRPGGPAPGPARTAPRRRHRDHLAPAHPGAGARGRRTDGRPRRSARRRSGARTRAPGGSAAPRRTAAGRGEARDPVLLRVRPEGQPPRATNLLRTVHGAKRPQPGLRARPVSPVRRRERPCGAHLLPGTALTGKAAWQC